jgi:hypothetical protein
MRPTRSSCCIVQGFSRRLTEPDIPLPLGGNMTAPAQNIEDLIGQIQADEVPDEEHAALSKFFATDVSDAKADDARLLLRAMREFLAGSQDRKIERGVGVHRGGVALPAQLG